MTDTNREALFREALRQIAAPSSVPLDQLPANGQPNGWRDIAVERIDIARAALSQAGGASD